MCQYAETVFSSDVIRTSNTLIRHAASRKRAYSEVDGLVVVEAEPVVHVHSNENRSSKSTVAKVASP